MRRIKSLFIFFVCWGLLICISSLWLVCIKQDELKSFARKLSVRQVPIYPVRAPIYDRNGVKIAWTEWEFYVQTTARQLDNAENFFRELNMDFTPLYNDKTRRYTQILPPDKTAAAIKLARKYRLRVRRNIVRRTLKLSPSAQYFIGNTLLYHGIYGQELKHDTTLKGRAGHYHIVQGGAGKIARGSLKVLLPMQEGKAVNLALSLLELQSGLFITEGWK